MPEQVSPALLDLTRSLGRPELDLVILAEGNTSEQIADDVIVVKASGASMVDADSTSFVSVQVAPLLTILEDESTGQRELSAALDASEAGGESHRASIETLIHVAVRAIAPVRFVAHTHPTDVVALLASVNAATAFALPVYSDELMVLGRSLYIPYAEPGIKLGRLFLQGMRRYVAEHGAMPSLVALGNHGIVAIADTADGVEAISRMAVKSARVRIGAMQAGGVAALTDDMVSDYFTRDDFRQRRASLAGITGDGKNE